jgi:hypothetical protein
VKNFDFWPASTAKLPATPYRAHDRPRPSARLRPSSTRPAKNAVVQLAHFNLCRRISPAEDGTCCQMFPRSASVRLLRQQLWRLGQSSLKPGDRQTLSAASLTVPMSAAGPASPVGLVGFVSVLFCVSAVFLSLNPFLSQRVCEFVFAERIPLSFFNEKNANALRG